MDENRREIVFEVTQESDGGFVAECLGEDIYTEADNWSELRENVQEAVSAFFFDSEKPVTFDSEKPARIRLHQVRDEVLISS